MSRTPRGGSSASASTGKSPNARVLIDYTARNTKLKTKYDIPKDGLVHVVRKMGGWIEVTLEEHTLEFSAYSALLNAPLHSDNDLNQKMTSSTFESKPSSLPDLKKLLSIVGQSGGNGRSGDVVRIPSIYVQHLTDKDEIKRLQQKWVNRAHQAKAQYERVQEKRKRDAMGAYSVLHESSGIGDQLSGDDDGDDDESSDVSSIDSSSSSIQSISDVDTDVVGSDVEDENVETIVRADDDSGHPVAQVQQFNPIEGESTEQEEESKEEATAEHPDDKDGAANISDAALVSPVLEPLKDSSGDEAESRETSTVDHSPSTLSIHKDASDGYLSSDTKKKGQSMTSRLKKTLSKMKSGRSTTIFSRLAFPASSLHEDALDTSDFQNTIEQVEMHQQEYEDDEGEGQKSAVDEKASANESTPLSKRPLTEEEAGIQIRETLRRILRGRRFTNFIYGSSALKDQRLRLATAKEILSSERSYVKSLGVCLDMFYRPLAGPNVMPTVSPEDIILEIDGHATDSTVVESTQQAKSSKRAGSSQKNVLARMRSMSLSSSHSGQSKYSSLLSLNELTSIFGNLPQIYSVNKALLLMLEKEWDKFPVFNVGAALIKFIPLLKCYMTFVNSYDVSASELDRLQRSSTKFNQFLEKRYVASGAHTLSTFLIMPVQRIPRYRMLLKDLLKRTPINHVDYESIHDAFVSVSELAEFLNEQKRLDENNKFVKRLQDTLDLGRIGLLQSHRNFIKRGKLYVNCMRRGIDDVCNVYLFSDMLIIVPCGPRSENTQGNSRRTASSIASFRKESIRGEVDHFAELAEVDKGRCQVIFFAFARLLEETLNLQEKRLNSPQVLDKGDVGTVSPVTSPDPDKDTKDSPSVFGKTNDDSGVEQDAEKGETGEQQEHEDQSEQQQQQQQQKEAHNDNDINDSGDIVGFTLEAFMKTTYFVFRFEALSAMDAREWHSNIMQQMQQIHLKIQSKNIYLQSTMGLYKKRRESLRRHSNRNMDKSKRLSRRASLLDPMDIDDETVSAVSIDRERGILYMKVQNQLRKLNRMRAEWNTAKAKCYAAERFVRESRAKVAHLQRMIVEQEASKKELETIMREIEERETDIGKDKDHYLSTLQELDAQILSALNGDALAFREVFNKDPVSSTTVFSEGGSAIESDPDLDVHTKKLESIKINYDSLVQSKKSEFFSLPQNDDAIVLLPSLPNTTESKSLHKGSQLGTSLDDSVLSMSSTQSVYNLGHKQKSLSRVIHSTRHRRSRSNLGPVQISRDVLKKMERFNPAGVDASALKQPRWVPQPAARRSTGEADEFGSEGDSEADENVLVASHSDDEWTADDNEDGIVPLPTRAIGVDQMVNLGMQVPYDYNYSSQKRIMVRSSEEIEASDPYVAYFRKVYEEQHSETLSKLAAEVEREEAESSGDQDGYEETLNIFYRTRPNESHFIIEQESLPYKYLFQRQRYCDGNYEIFDSPPLKLKWDPVYDRSDLYSSFNVNLHLMHQTKSKSNAKVSDASNLKTGRLMLNDLPDNAEELKLLVLQLSEEAQHWRSRFIEESERGGQAASRSHEEVEE